jgi:hypothetical protein
MSCAHAADKVVSNVSSVLGGIDATTRVRLVCAADVVSCIEAHVGLGRLARHAVLSEKKTERRVAVIYQLEQRLVTADLLSEQLHHFNAGRLRRIRNC